MLQNPTGAADVVSNADLLLSYRHYLAQQTRDPEVLALATDRRFHRQLAQLARREGWEVTSRRPHGLRVKLTRPHRHLRDQAVANPYAAAQAFLARSPSPHQLAVEVTPVPGDKEFGVIAREDIACHQVLCEYVGQYIDEAEQARRELVYDEQKKVPRIIHVQHRTGGLSFLDGYRHPDGTEVAHIHSNVGSMVNHSRERPNCRYLTVRGEPERVVLVSVCPIPRGQELLYDYAPPDRSADQPDWLLHT
jgi:hypothetical protein